MAKSVFLPVPYFEQHEIKTSYFQGDCKKFYGTKNVQIKMTDGSDNKNRSSEEDLRKNLKKSTTLLELWDSERNAWLTEEVINDETESDSECDIFISI